MKAQRCQIAIPRWPNDINSADDKVIFKNRVQNIECIFGCVERNAVLLKPNVANILLFIQHGPITIANYASGLKSAPNSNSFWVRRLFNVYVRVFCPPNATILLVCIPAKSYSFGERIKLIICQIRYELSVTYIHNWSLQPFSQDYWPSFSHHLHFVCVNFIYKWLDLQFKFDSERQIIWETFCGNFIYSQSFCQKSAKR